MSSIERYLRRQFERRTVKELEGSFKGPKKVKASGKPVGPKKKDGKKKDPKKKDAKSKKPAGKKPANRNKAPAGIVTTTPDGLAPPRRRG
jgi:ATP-dependent RNA helicase SrmB